MSDSVWPHRRQPTRLPCPWDSPGKNTGVGCHFLLQCMKVKKWKWSRSVMSDPQRPHGLQPSRLLRPWDFLGKSIGVGCHCLKPISKNRRAMIPIPQFLKTLHPILTILLNHMMLKLKKVISPYQKKKKKVTEFILYILQTSGSDWSIPILVRLCFLLRLSDKCQLLLITLDYSDSCSPENKLIVLGRGQISPLSL